MRLMPGQTAPQMPPRGAKGPINMGRPLNATGMPAGRPGMRGAGAGTPPPPTNVNPIRPGMRGAGAGTPQRQNTQPVMNAVMSGAGATPQRSFGAKKGGKVPSKMGAVKTSASRDGVAKKGKTKGRMV